MLAQSLCKHTTVYKVTNDIKTSDFRSARLVECFGVLFFDGFCLGGDNAGKFSVELPAQMKHMT